MPNPADLIFADAEAPGAPGESEREFAEMECLRAELLLRAGRGAEALATLDALPASLGADPIRYEADALRAAATAELPFDRWWAGQKRVAFTEVPGSAEAMHAAVFAGLGEGEAPSFPPESLPPLLRARAVATAAQGDYDSAASYWAALFRVAADDAAVAAETEALEAFLAEHGEALPREAYGSLVALPLERAPDQATRDRLSARLFKLFDAGAPEKTAAALATWGRANLTEGQRRVFAYQAADYLYKRGKYREAAAVLSEEKKLLDRELLLRALCRLKREEMGPAVADLDELAATYPESPLMDRALFTLGWARMVAGDKPKARLAFERVVADYPDSEYARQARNFLTKLTPEQF